MWREREREREMNYFLMYRHYYAGAPEMFRRAAAANPVSFAAPRPVKSMDLFPQQAGFGSAKGDAAAKVAAAAADSM